MHFYVYKTYLQLILFELWLDFTAEDLVSREFNIFSENLVGISYGPKPNQLSSSYSNCKYDTEGCSFSSKTCNASTNLGVHERENPDLDEEFPVYTRPGIVVGNCAYRGAHSILKGY